MIPVKVQCGCGQRYAFDVEPVSGHMPAPVKCPSCGVDGTIAANQIIAQALGAQPAVAVAAAAVPNAPAGGIRLAAIAPPPMPVPAPQSTARALPKAKRGADGWATEETQLNKLGTYITVGPPVLAALFASGMFGIEISPTVLATVVAIGGLLGGALNVAGRGPILAGSFIGVVIALGGYGTVYWWIQGRESVRKFEVLIAFAVGVIPGFLLQYGLQWILRKRAQG